MKMETVTSRLRAWLNNIPIQDPIERRIASLLQVVLIGLIVVVILATLVLVAFPGLSAQEKLDVIMSDLLGLLVVMLPLGLLRRGYFRGSTLLIISVLFITPTLAVTVVFDLPNSGGILFQFTLAILLAGLLLSRSALAFTFGLSACVVGFSAFRGQNGVPQLAVANMEIAINFILFNGLIALFLDRFGITLRAALKTALERESELKNEIDKHQQADEALVESEERYRKLIDSARDVIFTISTDSRITSLNPAFEIFTGWSCAEWLGRAFDELVAEDDRIRAHDQFNQIVRGETLRAIRLRMHTRAGEMLVVEMNISPQFKDDHVVGLLGIARDMTREQHAENVLKASEERYRMMFESNPQPMWIYDLETLDFLAVNEATIAYYGYSQKEFLRMTIKDIRPPEEIPALMENLVQKPQKLEWSGPWKHRKKDGTLMDVEVLSHDLLFGERQARLVLANDITARKQAEDALRESEARYHHILDTMMEGCQIIDFDWRYLYVNETVAAQQAQLKPEEMLNHTVMELYPGVENTGLFAVLRRCMEERVPTQIETEFIFPDGRVGWFKMSIQPAREGIFILSTDITARKQAEEALRESEKRYRNIFQTAAISIWEEDYSEVRMALDELRAQGVTDFRGYLAEHPDFAQGAAQKVKVLDVNEATFKLYGAKDKTELLGSLEKFVSPDNLYEELIAFAEGKTYFEKETSDLRLDGSLINLWMAITFFTDTAGFHKALVCISDLTERKQAEREMTLLSQAIKSMHESMVITDENNNILFVNHASQKTYGYESHELIGRHISIVQSNKNPPALIENLITATIHGTWEGELINKRKDGSEFPIHLSSSPVLDEEGKIIALIGVAEDITERKRAEEVLREQQSRQQKILDTMFAFVGLFSLDGILLEANRAPLDAAGLKAEDVIGKPFAELYTWSHSEATQTQVREAIQHAALGETVRDDFLMRIPSGQLITLDVVFSPLRDSFGNIIQVVGSSVDITERKQAEEKIQRQNLRLSALREIDTAILAADSVEDIVGAALSHIRELIECRRASLALIDWGVNEALIFDVRTDSETTVPKGIRVPLALFQDVNQTLSQNQPVLINDLNALADPPPQIQAGIREGFRSLCILPLFSQSNLIGAFSMSSEIPGFFDEEKISLGREVANQVAIAITQSRLVDELEERLREREKLIAELTAKNAELENFTYTVSHDLKSPLVTMKGFLGYLEQDAATGNVERLKSDTQRIANAVDKMHELLNDLLELSRIGRFVNPSETIPFEELVHGAIGLVGDRIQERGVTLDLQPDLPAVYGDRQRLIEVLQNLLDNAIKYLGDQPEPRIEIGQRGEEDGKLLFYIKDNGMGIAPEYRERVFGLFNKLDARSEGTGIGLALVRRIIEFHGGRIWVEADLEKGSVFCFTLPVT